jgi:hypothetical protein
MIAPYILGAGGAELVEELPDVLALAVALTTTCAPGWS